MTFFQYMQQQIKRDDIVGSVARDMNIDTKLFPSLELQKLTKEDWLKRILDKQKTGAMKDYINEAIETAVKEFELMEAK